MMSFLKALPRNTLPLARTRVFSTSPYARKSAVDSAKETLKSVDRTVSDAAVKGIEKGEAASQTIKETVGINASKAEGTASEMTDKAKGTTSETSGTASQKAQELAGEAKGTSSKMMGKAKGTVEEVKGTAKGKAEEIKTKM